MCEQLRIELGGATVGPRRERHFEVAGCAAPFPLCAIEACGFGVRFEAVQAGVEFPGAFAEAGVVVFAGWGPDGVG